jgi:hypothetical protein
MSSFFSGLNTLAIRRLGLFIGFCAMCYSSSADITFNGNVNYEKQINEQLSSKNTLEANFKLYEHPKFSLSISNAITVDLDCFQQEIKESLVFTTLRVDF